MICAYNKAKIVQSLFISISRKFYKKMKILKIQEPETIHSHYKNLHTKFYRNTIKNKIVQNFEILSISIFPKMYQIFEIIII